MRKGDIENCFGSLTLFWGGGEVDIIFKGMANLLSLLEKIFKKSFVSSMRSIQGELYILFGGGGSLS